MSSQVKFHQLFVIMTLFLYPLLFASAALTFVLKFPRWDFDLITVLLFCTFLVYIGLAIVVHILIKKYPAGTVSNSLEGCIYVFAVLTFVSSAFTLFFILVLAQIAFEAHEEKEIVVRFPLLFISASSVLASFFGVFTAVYSFRLLKLIKRNCLELARQIKDIGSNDQ